MNPENLVRAMCERHGLTAEHGTHLLPLVRKALAAPDEVRDRILKIVDGNLAQCAEGQEPPREVWDELDHEVLVAVARVLHNWAPSSPMLDLGSSLGRSSGPTENG